MMIKYPDLKQCSKEQLLRMQKDYEKVLDDMHSDPEFDGHSGSPGEWYYEKLDAIDLELKRRNKT